MPRLIITYQSGSQKQRKKDQARNGCKRIHRLRSMQDAPHDIEIVDADSGDLETLKTMPGVIRITPDVEVAAIDTTPNDPLYSVQYAHPLINSPEAWDTKTDASDVVVAIIDTGVDLHHEDLIDNLWEDPAPADPAWVHGRAFTSYTSSPQDDHGHGTHCAGIIGGRGNNDKGVCGVSWRVKIMAVKFLSKAGGGYLSDAFRAIDYAIQKGADIISNSWGGAALDTDAIDEVFEQAKARGILVVCAAGNGSTNHDSTWWKFIPADSVVENSISVAACGPGDTRTWWSDYGVKSIKVAAPGLDIASAYLGNQYAYMSGTSMACPCVSGVAALFMARFGKGYQAARDYILWASATGADYSNTLVTGGRVDVGRMFRYALDKHPIGLARLVDVQVAPDPVDEMKNVVTWLIPTGASGVIICAQDNTFPQEPGISVIHSSASDLTCSDTITSRDIPRFYSCWAVYGDKYSLPVRYRFGDYEPFTCPLPPPGYDFICNFFDEASVAYIELLSTGIYSQLWRAISSKYRTYHYGYAGGEAEVPVDRFSDPPQTTVLFDGYDLEAETEPLASDVMENQDRGRVAKFLWDCFYTLDSIRTGATLYSALFDREMKWSWLNYWQYRQTGKVRAYYYPTLFDEFFGAGALDHYEANFIDPANWHRLVACLRSVIHNLRVLFTTEVPYYSSGIGLGSKVARMDDITPTATDTAKVWAVWTPETLDYPRLIPPENILHDVVGIGPVYRYGYGSPCFDGRDISPAPNSAGPSINLTLMRSWPNRARWFIPTVPPSIQEILRPLEQYAALSYDTNYAQVADIFAPITPPAFDPEEPRWKYRGPGSNVLWMEGATATNRWITHSDFGSMLKFGYKGAEYHFLDSRAYEAERKIYRATQRLHFPSSYDWEEAPVLVTITLRVSYTTPNTSMFPGLPIMGQYGVECLPQQDETGYIRITLSGDVNGAYDFNPTTLHKNGVSETVVAEWTFDSDGPHIKDLGMDISLALDTLPHVVREFVGEAGEGEFICIPPALYTLRPGSQWILTPFTSVDRGEYPPITWEGGYLMNRWAGLFAELIIETEVV